jgi:predicted peptidase
MVLAELEQTRSEFSADPKRLYLAGVSMGGFGAWHLAAGQPGKFAALVVVCGGSTLTSGDRFTPVARKVGRTPVWVFHGSEDRVVPVTESRGMVEALKSVEGSRVRYNEYEGAGHNVWLNAAAEPDLLPWLLSQRAD